MPPGRVARSTDRRARCAARAGPPASVGRRPPRGGQRQRTLTDVGRGATHATEPTDAGSLQPAAPPKAETSGPERVTIQRSAVRHALDSASPSPNFYVPTRRDTSAPSSLEHDRTNPIIARHSIAALAVDGAQLAVLRASRVTATHSARRAAIATAASGPARSP